MKGHGTISNTTALLLLSASRNDLLISSSLRVSFSSSPSTQSYLSRIGSGELLANHNNTKNAPRCNDITQQYWIGWCHGGGHV
jgi:hypothetical protein